MKNNFKSAKEIIDEMVKNGEFPEYRKITRSEPKPKTI